MVFDTFCRFKDPVSISFFLWASSRRAFSFFERILEVFWLEILGFFALTCRLSRSSNLSRVVLPPTETPTSSREASIPLLCISREPACCCEIEYVTHEPSFSRNHYLTEALTWFALLFDFPFLQLEGCSVVWEFCFYAIALSWVHSWVHSRAKWSYPSTPTARYWIRRRWDHNFCTTKIVIKLQEGDLIIIITTLLRLLVVVIKPLQPEHSCCPFKSVTWFSEPKNWNQATDAEANISMLSHLFSFLVSGPLLLHDMQYFGLTTLTISVH